MRVANAPLVWTGMALFVAGALMLVVTLIAGGPPNVVPLVGESQAQVHQPWQLWVVVSGLMLAAGGACLGVGMNRWRAE